MKPYELLVFDWDGTLMDSAHRIVTCMQRAAADTGHAAPDDSAVRDIIGLGMQEAVARLFPAFGAEQVDEFIDAYRRHWMSDDIPASMLFPGAEELIRWARQQGYLLAVATGKSRRGLDKVLEETSLKDCFQMTRCADEAHSKPHPQMLQDILVDLDTAPGDALVLGDSEYDMQMAANAGVDAVAVSHGVHERERLRGHGALAVFDRLMELPDWLEEITEKRKTAG